MASRVSAERDLAVTVEGARERSITEVLGFTPAAPFPGADPQPIVLAAVANGQGSPEVAPVACPPPARPRSRSRGQPSLLKNSSMTAWWSLARLRAAMRDLAGGDLDCGIGEDVVDADA